MSKWSGIIGFTETTETVPGVWEESVIERKYLGDVIRQKKTVLGGDKLTDDIKLTNDVSILADPYIMNHLRSLRYICYMGVRWKVTDVEPQYPRLILTTGGVYNGEDET